MKDVKALPHQTRRDRAAATRHKILDQAYQLFCAQGYTAVTMEAIAAAAAVAVQTVYYVFRTKAALLRAVIEAAAAGAPDPPPVAQRSWMQQALTAPDGHRALALTIEHGVDIYLRVAPLGPTIQAAVASDPDIAAYWRDVTLGRRTGMQHLIARLANRGQLRSGLTVERATDILFVLYSHETCLGLTRDAGWSVPDYKAWLYALLVHQLLGGTSGEPHATQGLSYHGLLHADPSQRPGLGSES